MPSRVSGEACAPFRERGGGGAGGGARPGGVPHAHLLLDSSPSGHRGRRDGQGAVGTNHRRPGHLQLRRPPGARLLEQDDGQEGAGRRDLQCVSNRGTGAYGCLPRRSQGVRLPLFDAWWCVGGHRGHGDSSGKGHYPAGSRRRRRPLHACVQQRRESPTASGTTR